MFIFFDAVFLMLDKLICQ